MSAGSRHERPLLSNDQADEQHVFLSFDESTEFEPALSDKPVDQPVSASWIAIVLILVVVGFTVNTEATAYFQDELHWKKPVAIFYITHSSLVLPWVCYMAYQRWTHWHIPLRGFARDYRRQLQTSISLVPAFSSGEFGPLLRSLSASHADLAFLALVTAIVSVVLTSSGLSWFFSLTLTTPADLTAIYNCSTFFAAALSVPLLNERLDLATILAVLLSVVGTFVIAYGDVTSDHAESAIGTSRLLGNLIAAAGSVAFGLYEVLMKKWTAAVPTFTHPSTAQHNLNLSLTTAAGIGVYTFAVLWTLVLTFHMLRIEVLELPNLYTAMWIAISVLSGSFSIALVALLVNWTDPIFGSMANVLSLFFVAIADWIMWGLVPSLATYVGGALIFIAFALLARGHVRPE